MSERHTSAALAETLSPAAIRELRQGRVIDAIKVVREERGVDLKAAKFAVDAYIAKHPDVKQALADARASARPFALLWVAVFVVVVGLVYALVERG